MAQDKRALILIAFNPSNGLVSINGGAWRRLRLVKETSEADKPGQTPTPESRKAKDFPPPGKGDDDVECLVCDEHGTCHLHLYDGTMWLDLGDDCRGQFCSM